MRITDKTIDELIRMLTMKSTDRRSSTFQRGIAQEVVWALTELKEIRDRKESIPCKGTVS